MDWGRTFDSYCERTDPGYWSEPVNAVTNLAFIAIAILMWRRSYGHPAGRVLAGILFVIGVGSYLFHTHATLWAVLLDVLPILLFSLFYIYLANRDYWGLKIWSSAVGAAGLKAGRANAVAVLERARGVAKIKTSSQGPAVGFWNFGTL